MPSSERKRIRFNLERGKTKMGLSENPAKNDNEIPVPETDVNSDKKERIKEIFNRYGRRKKDGPIMTTSKEMQDIFQKEATDEHEKYLRDIDQRFSS